jgi:hypothetical protein
MIMFMTSLREQKEPSELLRQDLRFAPAGLRRIMTLLNKIVARFYSITSLKISIKSALLSGF